ncbi:hypothetical protein SNE40_003988 [Patella caerulea]|uniref:Uncharacterized protein n=1 Tax=Patella caerulea TaxID=87958 RepID=A0AAN8KCN5_PATCE
MSRCLQLILCFVILVTLVVTQDESSWKPCQHGAGCFCPPGKFGKCAHGECHCHEESAHMNCEFNIDCVKLCDRLDAICFNDHHCHCNSKHVKKYVE